MPEGHTIHRLARDHRDRFAGMSVAVTSPQGRFTAAGRVDGLELADVEAFGKHLFYRFPGPLWVHVHLGLFGTVRTQPTPLTDPGPTVRMRLANHSWFADLVGPTQCSLIDIESRERVLTRLGPDPLRADARAREAFAAISRSRQPIAALLMNQRVLAGVGNVYRAEVLFRAGLDPYRPGREVVGDQWGRLWLDLRRLMRAGVRANRIVTTAPRHRVRASGTARDSDATYVYRRQQEPCRICRTPVSVADLGGRRLYWCSECQC